MLWKLFKKIYDKCLHVAAILCVFLMGSYFLSHSTIHIAQSIYKQFDHMIQIYIVSDLNAQDAVISGVTKTLDKSMSRQYMLHIVSADLFLQNPQYNPIMIIQRDNIGASGIHNMNLIPITSPLISKIDKNDVSDHAKTIKLSYHTSQEKYIIGIPQNSYNQKLSQKLLDNILIEFNRYTS